MAGVLDRLLKNSTIELADKLSDSKFFAEKDFIQTQVPMVNVAFSGQLDGGLSSGSTIFAGPSKHFKTAFLMLCIRAYFDKYPDGACLFYDSEFGAPQNYFEAFGIDLGRVLHTPIKDIEELKFDVIKQVNELEEGDRVIIIVDSLGNLASKKEVEDALEQKSVADMTRAKAMKSLFRMLTPFLTIKDIPFISAGHTYKEMSLYPKDILSGGTGYYYSAQNIFFISRQQEKDEKTKELEGFNFGLTVEKSRYVKEKSKVTLEVSYEAGINSWSGLLEVALESGHVTNEKQGWYQKKGDEKSYRADDTNSRTFWESILQDTEFQQFVKDKFLMKKGTILQDLSQEDELTEAIEEVPAKADSFAEVKKKSKRAK